MTEAIDTRWSDDPFFRRPPAASIDGATTSHGPLWHCAPARWGHSLHSMCSYQGMFPARLAHYFIDAYSTPGDAVLDPFCGRGTTTLQARIEGRVGISADLNPLAYVLSKAKTDPPRWSTVMSRIDKLEKQYAEIGPLKPRVADEIRMLFDAETLSQLVFIRSTLLAKPWSRWGQVDFMIGGAVAGILHGKHRRDGTSAYLSISMPNTFSMSPAYVSRYIADHRLTPPVASVFRRLREKLARLYFDDPAGPPGRVEMCDAIQMMESRVQPDSVDLLLTSPPYLNVVNYGTSNWIRLWWLGTEDVSSDGGAGRRHLDALLDHGHNYKSYSDFTARFLEAASRVLKRDGLAVLVIGDVSYPSGRTLRLAEQVWRDVGDHTGLRLLDILEDNLPDAKVSRIWGETRGRATEIDRILLLCRDDGAPRTGKDVSWDEPYKAAGPDAAHRLLEQT
jgi:DNA modification methylase